MRIISGTLKGKRIIPPKKLPVRPTTDRSKEAVFNILVHKYNFENLKEQHSTQVIFFDFLTLFGILFFSFVILFPFYMMLITSCLLYTSPSPRDVEESRMPSSA